MVKRNQEIRYFIEDFLHWLNTRHYYAKKLPLNILEQFKPSKTREAPDAPLDKLCAAFYLSLQLEIDRDISKAKCFLWVYFPKARPTPIKTLAHELSIDRDTVLEWAHRSAENMFRLAKANVALTEMMSAVDLSGKTVPAKRELLSMI